MGAKPKPGLRSEQLLLVPGVLILYDTTIDMGLGLWALRSSVHAGVKSVFYQNFNRMAAHCSGISIVLIGFSRGSSGKSE